MKSTILKISLMPYFPCIVCLESFYIINNNLSQNPSNFLQISFDTPSCPHVSTRQYSWYCCRCRFTPFQDFGKAVQNIVVVDLFDFELKNIHRLKSIVLFRYIMILSCVDMWATPSKIRSRIQIQIRNIIFEEIILQ